MTQASQIIQPCFLSTSLHKAAYCCIWWNENKKQENVSVASPDTRLYYRTNSELSGVLLIDFGSIYQLYAPHPCTATPTGWVCVLTFFNIYFLLKQMKMTADASCLCLELPGNFFNKKKIISWQKSTSVKKTSIKTFSFEKKMKSKILIFFKWEYSECLRVFWLF